MSGPGCGAYAHNLIHCSFNSFGKTPNQRLPFNGKFHERQSPCQNVFGGIRVPVMLRTTGAARPLAYCQVGQALGAGTRMTGATLLRGVALTHLIEPYRRVIAFVLQHGSECAPASIQNAFRHFGFCQPSSIHITDKYRPVLFGQTGAQLVQKVFSTVCNLRMDCLDPFLLFARCAVANWDSAPR